MAGELVSCFLGPLSNLVAAHFWDGTTQADVDCDVLYQGRPNRRTPRTLLVDFKEAVSVEYTWRLGEQVQGLDLSALGTKWIPPVPMALDEEAEDGEEEPLRCREYSGDLAHEAQKKRRVDSGSQENNAIPDDEEGLADLHPKPAPRGLRPGWQYIVPQLHTDSLQLVSEGAANNPTGLGLFSMFPMGADAQLFNIDLFVDPVRRFVEGCDSLQGYHVTCDALGAFGGLAHRLVENLKDDLGNRPVFLQAVHQQTTPQPAHQLLQETTQSLNLGFSTIDLSGVADAYVPLNIADWQFPSEPSPHPLLLFDLKTDAVAQTAVIAASMDTYLLPTRSVASVAAFQLGELCRTLRVYNSLRISSLFSAVPFPLLSTYTSLAAAFHSSPLYSPAFLPLSHILPPNPVPQAVGQAVVFRGLDDLPLNPPDNQDRFDSRQERLTYISSKDEALELFCSSCPSLRCLARCLPRAYPISAAFPSHILSSSLDSKGHISPCEGNVVQQPQGGACHKQPQLAAYPQIPCPQGPPCPTPAPVVGEMPLACHLATTPGIHGHLHLLAETFAKANPWLLPNYGRDIDDWRETKNALMSIVDEYADGAVYSDDDDVDI
eukprot:GGOE01062030.1.p1 GENE.GGOE01062030.1~~GGOE01062030.1.p1  ORF type:complete len:611 (+),score=116.79 GGOE01062030.1:22-1833(+)